MSEAAKPGPAIAQSVEEVEGIFPSDAALEDAVARLTKVGFDRAELSLPAANPPPSQATPERGAETVTTETDMRQMRTLGTGLAASAAGMAAAGAVIATGGAAAAAVGAAAVAGLSAGALTDAAGKAGDRVRQESRAESAVRGDLVLAVRTGDPARQALAATLMQAAGATRTATVRRGDGTIC
jgi:hypothetical protein